MNVENIRKTVAYSLRREVAKDSVSRVAPPVRADVWRASRNAGAKDSWRGVEGHATWGVAGEAVLASPTHIRKGIRSESEAYLLSGNGNQLSDEKRVSRPVATDGIFIHVEPASRHFVVEAVEEGAELLLLVILTALFWAIPQACLWIRYLGARW